MTSTAIIHDVELLRDAKGVYGIGVAREAAIDSPPKDLVLRRDRLPEGESSYAVLQMITGGFRYGVFINTAEEEFRKVIHHGLLRRAGLPWPPINGSSSYWSSDPQQKIRNRQIYHGLRL